MQRAMGNEQWAMGNGLMDGWMDDGWMDGWMDDDGLDGFIALAISN